MMMPGVNPVQMAVLAFALLAVFFLAARERHRARGPLYYCGYKPLKLITWIAGLIPGGAWAMAGKPVHCAVVCSIVALLGMPLAKWPADSRGFLEYTAGLTPYYVSAWLLMFLGVLYVGCFVRDQGSVGD